MRMSDLIGSEVLGPDGRPMAVVTDVRLVADGPPRGLAGNATLRVRGLVLSRHHTGSMLGYDRRGGIGPKLVAAAVRWLHREARFAGWEHVAAVEPEQRQVRLDAELGDLPRLL